MNYQMRISVKAICGVLTLGIAILLLPVNAPAESDLREDFSFDDCEFFQAQARIMDVKANKAQLVAAEQTIYVVSWNMGGRLLTTELMDADGDPLELGSLEPGQWILVKGFIDIEEGGVIASLIQRIESPEHSKPVLRKINKAHRHDKRFQRRVRARNR